MSRTTGRRLQVLLSSTFAVTALITACSQPSSYATVDLSGSLPDRMSQAYSPVTGAPVYQSTQVYTVPNQSPGYTPYAQSQLAYTDAAPDQVASIQFDYDPSQFQRPEWNATVGYPQQSYVPQGSISVAEAPVSPRGVEDYVNIGPLQAPPTGLDMTPSYAPPPPPPMVEAAPTPQMMDPFDLPVGGFVDLETPDVTYSSRSPAPSLLPAPVELPSVEVAVPETVTVEVPSFPPAAVPAPPPSFVQEQVSSDYTIPYVNPGIDPRRFLTQPPAPEPVAPSDPGNAYRDLMDEETAQPTVRNTRLPAPQFVRPQREMRLPAPSDAYPRPYEALRPGIYPPLTPDVSASLQQPQAMPEERGVWADLALASTSEVPTTAPAPSYIAVPATAIEQHFDEAATVAISGAEAVLDEASDSYVIKPGDTLFSIGRAFNLPPQAIADANGISFSEIIFPGQTIQLPQRQGSPTDTLGDAPVVVLETVEYLPATALVRDYETAARDAFESGQWQTVPVVEAETVAMALAPPQADIGRVSWPVQGRVYRLSEGQVEIKAAPGTPVSASASGIVHHIEDGPLGVLVVIEHSDGWSSVIVGLDAQTVVRGQRVEEGTILGSVDGRGKVRLELRDDQHNIAEVLRAIRS